MFYVYGEEDSILSEGETLTEALTAYAKQTHHVDVSTLDLADLTIIQGEPLNVKKNVSFSVIPAKQ